MEKILKIFELWINKYYFYWKIVFYILILKILICG